MPPALRGARLLGHWQANDALRGRWGNQAALYLRSYAPDGGGITLHGPPGTGKTRLASILACELLQTHRVVWTSESHLFEAIKTAWSDPDRESQVLNRFRLGPHLFIDDFGVRRATDYVLETYQAIFDTRYLHHMPTSITTNHPPEKLRADYPRVMDRLARNTVVAMVGPSARGTELER